MTTLATATSPTELGATSPPIGAPPPRAEAAPEPVPRPEPTTWAQGFLSPSPQDTPRAVLQRTGTGLALLASYGVAMGLGAGPLGMYHYTVVCCAAVLSVLALALPALQVLLALLDAPITPWQLASNSSRAVFRIGLLLAGVAPALALYTTTTDRTFAALLGIAGFFLGGLLGLGGLVRELGATLRPMRAAGLARGMLALLAFAVFSVALVLRVSTDFPVLGGVR